MALLKDLPIVNAAIYLLLASGSCLPGVLFIFIFYRNLFREFLAGHDWQFLLLLSFAISGPFLIWCIFLSWLIEDLRWAYSGREVIFGASIVNGSLLFWISFSFSILYGYFFRLSGRKMISLLTLVHLIFYLIYCIDFNCRLFFC